jgi:phosphosulfolactate phosphohydrolase-like enzyme
VLSFVALLKSFDEQQFAVNSPTHHRQEFESTEDTLCSNKISNKVSSTNSCKVLPQHISADPTTETATYRLKSSSGNTPFITKSSHTTTTHIPINITILKNIYRKNICFIFLQHAKFY